MAGRGAKPGERRGGRKKGTPNKRTLYLERMKERAFDPFEITMQIAAGEVEETEVVKDAKGKPVAVKVPLSWRLRLDAAKELMQYIAPKLRAIEHSGPDGGPIPVTRIVREIVDPRNDPED